MNDWIPILVFALAAASQAATFVLVGILLQKHLASVKESFSALSGWMKDLNENHAAELGREIARSTAHAKMLHDRLIAQMELNVKLMRQAPPPETNALKDVAPLSEDEMRALAYRNAQQRQAQAIINAGRPNRNGAPTSMTPNDGLD